MQGSIPEVITLQASCESIGIPTYVPDMNLIQADPFMRGGNALALELFVPEDRLEDARAILPARSVREARPRNELEILGRRTRWCSLLWLTAPVGIWLGLRYMRATRALAQKPDQHGWTIAAFWFSIVVTLISVLMYTKMLQQH
jgi:hypothetical protein